MTWFIYLKIFVTDWWWDIESLTWKIILAESMKTIGVDDIIPIW